MAERKRVSRSKKAQKKVEGEPNIQFVGRERMSNKEFREFDAPPFVMIGARKIELPDDATQKAGFYLPPRDASALRRMYAHLWKAPKAKG